MEKALILDMYINTETKLCIICILFTVFPGFSMILDQIDPGSRSDSYFISGFSLFSSYFA